MEDFAASRSPAPSFATIYYDITLCAEFPVKLVTSAASESICVDPPSPLPVLPLRAWFPVEHHCAANCGPRANYLPAQRAWLTQTSPG